MPNTGMVRCKICEEEHRGTICTKYGKKPRSVATAAVTPVTPVTPRNAVTTVTRKSVTPPVTLGLCPHCVLKDAEIAAQAAEIKWFKKQMAKASRDEPPEDGAPMSAAERMRRMRAKKKGANRS